MNNTLIEKYESNLTDCLLTVCGAVKANAVLRREEWFDFYFKHYYREEKNKKLERRNPRTSKEDYAEKDKACARYLAKALVLIQETVLVDGFSLSTIKLVTRKLMRNSINGFIFPKVRLLGVDDFNNTYLFDVRFGCKKKNKSTYAINNLQDLEAYLVDVATGVVNTFMEHDIDDDFKLVLSDYLKNVISEINTESVCTNLVVKTPPKYLHSYISKMNEKQIEDMSSAMS